MGVPGLSHTKMKTQVHTLRAKDRLFGGTTLNLFLQL